MPVATKAKCEFCGRSFTKRGMSRHLMSCSAREQDYARRAAEHPGWKSVRMAHLRVEGEYAPDYWMHIELPLTATLYQLDQFLRDIWLECCGHLSAFTINGQRYDFYVENTGPLMFPPPEHTPGQPLRDEDLLTAEQYREAMLADARRRGLSEQQMAWFEQSLIRMTTEENSMDVPLSEVLTEGLNFEYEYDFGSTTPLKLRVVEMLEHRVPPGAVVTIMARNDPPEIMCDKCGANPAAYVCPFCQYGGEGWLCADCARAHLDESSCGVEALLPVVNSPRAGECGYTGDGEVLGDW